MKNFDLILFELHYLKYYKIQIMKNLTIIGIIEFFSTIFIMRSTIINLQII